MALVALIDYGAGNLTSIRKALGAVGADVFTPTSPADLDRASHIVVPGVGHFGRTSVLDQGWKGAILAGIDRGRPLLGICLGLQWLFEESAEAPGLAGLGAFRGRCFRLTASGETKVPHVGWNELRFVEASTPPPATAGGEAQTPSHASRLLAGVDDRSQAYFTHSYVAPVTEVTVAVTEHGQPFASAVERGIIWGVQFHPEKSSAVGLQILRNFVSTAVGR